ncbi:TPA: PRD domain-containing protein [Enterococcus faecalis]|uniref:PRD domain-containing protein n=1 Tax=Enterococcus TaxID=1350 RepID=UPI0001B2BE6D|nr:MULTISPECIES: PRD domain-containing protein [Enterococcus]HAP3745444.1 PRD domain-containing protein [Enterococcus faecalis TDR28]HAP3751373.1 PRD domain-containing protein [Enterococcus faecalis TDR22]HAP3754373.1 PRD domain-containing protein [Enterococcus faecalis TDR13]HAP3757357.1 PRD domain-containing protein [Enterococcus faecalis TDR7]HAP3768226.1 PRD domain-containing protein [Enterococcus faecalis TDR19]HAP4961285.1 PRD domain-containing protein [Enterococcus faecalis ADL-336]
MKIKKVLNQNAVLVLDEGQEKVAVGKGVGFNKTKNDVLSRQLVERMFVMEPEGLKKLQVLLSQIEDKYFLASEEIIQHAETVLGEKLNEHINIGLSDHIAFAAENIQNNIIVRNKLLSEIEILYSEEFAIAQWAVEYLTQTLEIPFSYDEAGYIVIHIHSARSGRTDNSKSIREVTIVSEIIHLIEQELAIDIHDDKNSLSYSRLVNHLRLFIHRFQQNQYAVLDEEILEVVKKKYAESYEISKKVQVLLMRNFHYQVPNEELGYLSIHIERLRMTK